LEFNLKKLLILVVSTLLLAGSGTLAYYSPNLPLAYTPTEKGVSAKDAQEVYDNLLKYTGIPSYRMPKLLVITSTQINAYADPTNWQIGLYTGMLQYIKTKDELAAVLGHELGHIMMQHDILNPNNDKDLQAVLEGNADKFAIYLMLRSGYDICQAKNLWERLRVDNGDYEINTEHPNFSYRIWQLQFAFCQHIYY
jgi:hypothetical protein